MKENEIGFKGSEGYASKGGMRTVDPSWSREFDKCENLNSSP
jgi:hypothetical protein